MTAASSRNAADNASDEIEAAVQALPSTALWADGWSARRLAETVLVAAQAARARRPTETTRSSGGDSA